MKEQPIDDEVKLGSKFYESFTPGARSYLDKTVKEYADKLVVEANNIEKMEHTGGGHAEITAAHVEEAKWVSIRRIRKKAASSKWPVVLRMIQIAMSAVIGIGASNFFQTWGALMCVGGILFGSISLIIEREIDR